jgi:predicted PurR-regulated permease PerM
MEYVAVLALAAIVSVIYGFVQPKVFGASITQSWQGNYFGNVALTTGVIFVAIIAAGWLFKLVGERVKV